MGTRGHGLLGHGLRWVRDGPWAMGHGPWAMGHGPRWSPGATRASPASHRDARVLRSARNGHNDEVRIDEVRIDEVRIDEVRIDEVRIDEVRIDEVRKERAHREVRKEWAQRWLPRVQSARPAVLSHPPRVQSHPSDANLRARADVADFTLHVDVMADVADFTSHPHVVFVGTPWRRVVAVGWEWALAPPVCCEAARSCEGVRGEPKALTEMYERSQCSRAKRVADAEVRVEPNAA